MRRTGRAGSLGGGEKKKMLHAGRQWGGHALQRRGGGPNPRGTGGPARKRDKTRTKEKPSCVTSQDENLGGQPKKRLVDQVDKYREVWADFSVAGVPQKKIYPATFWCGGENTTWKTLGGGGKEHGGSPTKNTTPADQKAKPM